MKTTLYSLTLLIFVLLAFVPNSFAQDDSPRVRLVYFLPKDSTPNPNAEAQMRSLLKDAQQFYADEMERHGFGRKTFRLETDTSGDVVVHQVRGSFDTTHYQGGSATHLIVDELSTYAEYSSIRDIHFIVVESRQTTTNTIVGAVSLFIPPYQGFALIDSWYFAVVRFQLLGIVNHELGHAFGLQHDWRDDFHIMSYGYSRSKLSKCAAEWLDVYHAFNPHQRLAANDSEMEADLISLDAVPEGFRLRFKIRDLDGIHQAQLIGRTGRGNDTSGLIACKSLNGVQTSTVEFVTELPVTCDWISLNVIDVQGNVARYGTPIDLLPFLPPVPLPPLEVVEIPDATLAEAVRQEIGDSITTHTMLGLFSLKYDSGNKITDLTGLEHAYRLILLWLSRNNISDLSPLAGLTELESLSFFDNNISDLSPLAGLTQLRTLSLSGNNISDLSPLAGLTELESLSLSGNNISDLSPLAGLTELESLSLSENNISDLSPLAGLTNLSQLWLVENPIKNLQPLLTLLEKNPDVKIYLKWGGVPLSVTLEVISGGGQSARVNQQLANPFVVRVKDQDGNAMSGVSVSFSVTPSGTLNPSRATTDSNGQAETRLTLGGTTGTYTVTARASGITQPVSFTATATLAFRPTEVANQTFTVGSTIQPLRLPVAAGGTAPYTYTLSPIPAGLSFDTTTRLLSGTPTTAAPATPITYTATDATGASATLNFNIEVIGDGEVPGPGPGPVDVNADGQVTVIDLAIVALFYGTQVPAGLSLPADVNADGIVNILDLTAVAQGLDAAAGNAGELSLGAVEAALAAAAEQAADLEDVAAAPMGFSTRPDVLSSGKAYVNVTRAFTDARHLAVSDMLSAFLVLLTEMREVPDTTALLPNYPNPFNPETWIPYHLSKETEVTLTIYDVRGVLVRALTLGHQASGVYESRGRAAYWDGRNASGEPVASGVYFYTLTAGDFSATRKMLIRK